MERTDDEKAALWAAYQGSLAEALDRFREVDKASSAGTAPTAMEEREALGKSLLAQFRRLMIGERSRSNGLRRTAPKRHDHQTHLRPCDPVQLGKLMVDIATGALPDGVDDGRDAAAAANGRTGGRSRTSAYSLLQST